MTNFEKESLLKNNFKTFMARIMGRIMLVCSTVEKKLISKDKFDSVIINGAELKNGKTI